MFVLRSRTFLKCWTLMYFTHDFLMIFSQLKFFLEEIELPVNKFGRMLAILPSLLTLSLDKKLRPTCRFLVHHVGIPQQKLTSIICFFPQVNMFCIHLGPICHWYLVSYIAMCPVANLYSRVCGDLQVLCISIEKKLNPTINYLINVVGVPREKVAGVLCKRPQLFGYLSEKMQRTISFLRNEVCTLCSIACIFRAVCMKNVSDFHGLTGRCVGARHPWHDSAVSCRSGLQRGCQFAPDIRMFARECKLTRGKAGTKWGSPPILTSKLCYQITKPSLLVIHVSTSLFRFSFSKPWCFQTGIFSWLHVCRLGCFPTNVFV
jgi:hypothetical protein